MCMRKTPKGEETFLIETSEVIQTQLEVQFNSVAQLEPYKQHARMCN